MSQNQGTVLRNGKIIDSSSDTAPPEDLNMAQTNSNDSDTNDGSDISSQLSEIKESYERRINELHQEFSQLKVLMMAIRMSIRITVSLSHLVQKVLQSRPSSWGPTW